MSTPLNPVILCSCGKVITIEEDKVNHYHQKDAEIEQLEREKTEDVSFSSKSASNSEDERPRCSHCHQTIKERYKITLTRHMVVSMRNVYMWCGENKRHTFRRYEINHLLAKDETGKQGAHFGDLVYFGGILYKIKKGVWGMHMRRAKAFLHGEKMINTEAWKTPGEEGAEEFAPKFVSQVKDIKELLDENYFFVPEYESTEQQPV